MSIAIPGYSSSADRFEFCCVRGLYGIPFSVAAMIVSVIYGLMFFVLFFINFLSVLIGGTFSESYYNTFTKYTAWIVGAQMYFGGVTSQRPPFFPE